MGDREPPHAWMPRTRLTPHPHRQKKPVTEYIRTGQQESVKVFSEPDAGETAPQLEDLRY